MDYFYQYFAEKAYDNSTKWYCYRFFIIWYSYGLVFLLEKQSTARLAAAATPEAAQRP